jgi:hypothetical protein
MNNNLSTTSQSLSSYISLTSTSPTNNIINHDKLINLIKENFNEEDNKLFNLSYEMSIKTQDNPNDFVIDFDDIYKWVGFNQKGHAKRLLLKEM